MSRPSQGEELRALFRTAVRFGLVGIATVGVYFAVLAALHPVLKNIVYLSASAYAISAVFNYIVQSQVTFGVSFADGRAVIRYLAMHGGLMGLNSVLMYLLVTVLELWLYGAQLLVTCIVAISSFAISHAWVYREAPQRSSK